ncbi:MAG: hypothetical protein AMS25_09580 [Gemmatimonas sp. SM23_52]|nr:MAG: hypothetical protein AMS25_09580 [Gemmatimonas sp. SM23_52]
MAMRRIVCLVLALAAATASQLPGQNCFRGRPLPTCRVFAITEIGFGAKLTREPFTHGLASADLGLMVNLSQDYALGGSLYVGFEDFTDPGYWRFGIKARVRRWLTPWLSLDVAPGIMGYSGEVGDGSDLTFTSQISLSFRDQLVLTTQLEYLRYEDYGRVLDAYAGLRFGSQPAVAAALLSGFAALMASGWDY